MVLLPAPMEGLKTQLDTLHWFGAKFLKPAKRSLVGTGKMMRTFHTIRAAKERQDYVAIQAILDGLLNSTPYMWSNRYGKHVQLVALCRYLLAENSFTKTRTYYDLLPLLHDETHELTREIVALIFGFRN